MNPLLKKLNYKHPSAIVVLNTPSSFESALGEMSQVTEVYTHIPADRPVAFALIFATTQVQVNQAASPLVPLLQPDGVLWFAYPKGTSKKYSCDFNRDTGWQILGDMGFEGVRQVAIDEDWTALRFRQAKYIKSLTRNPRMAMSPDGKARTANKSSGAVD